MTKRLLITIYICSSLKSFAIDMYENESDSITLSISKEDRNDSLTEVENHLTQNALPSLNDLYNDMSILDFQLPTNLYNTQLQSIDCIHETKFPEHTIQTIEPSFAIGTQNISLPNSIQPINLHQESIGKTLSRKNIIEKKPFKAERKSKLDLDMTYSPGDFFKLLHQFSKTINKNAKTLSLPLPTRCDIPQIPTKYINNSTIILNENIQLKQRPNHPIIKHSPNTIEKIHLTIEDQKITFDGSEFIVNEKRMWIKGGINSTRSKILINAMKKQPIPDCNTAKNIHTNIQGLNRRLSGLNCAIKCQEGNLSLVKYIRNKNQINNHRSSHKADLLRAVPNFQLSKIYNIDKYQVSINENLQLCIDGVIYEAMDTKYAPKKMALLAQLIVSYPNGVYFSDNQSHLKRKWRQWLQDQCFSGTEIFVEISGNILRLNSKN